MDLAELDILYLQDMAILDTSGSDETWAGSWASAKKNHSNNGPYQCWIIPLEANVTRSKTDLYPPQD